MDNEIVWNKKSIIDLAKDTYKDKNGNISLSGSTLSIGRNSYITYEYDFGNTGEIIKTKHLCLSANMSSNNTSLETRYNENMYVELVLQYWKEDDGSDTGFSSGNFDTIKIYPYSRNEGDGYTKDNIVSIRNDYVKKLKVKIAVGDIGDNDKFTLSGVLLRTEATLEEIFEGLGGNGARLKSIESYDDGMVAYYTDTDLPVSIKVEQIINGKAYTCNVSDKYTFNIGLHKGNMPWDREAREAREVIEDV